MFTPWSTPFQDFSGVGSKIPADFPNLIRLQIPNALDGADGGTYSPTLPIIIDGPNGLQVLTLVLRNGGTFTVNAGATIQTTGSGQILINNGGLLRVLSGGDLIINSGGDLVLSGSGTVASGGVLAVAFGGQLNVLGLAQIESELDVVSGGILDVKSGGLLSIDGIATVQGLIGWNSGSSGQFASGSELDMAGTLKIQSGGLFRIQNGGIGQIQNGGALTAQSGGTIEAQSGSTVQIDAGAQYNATIHGGVIALDAATDVTDASGILRTGPTTLNGGAARMGWRPIAFDAAAGRPNGDQNATFDIWQWDYVFMFAFTGNRTWRITAPPSSLQCAVTICNANSSGGDLTVKDDGTGATLAVIVSGNKMLFVYANGSNGVPAGWTATGA